MKTLVGAAEPEEPQGWNGWTGTVYNTTATSGTWVCPNATITWVQR